MLLADERLEPLHAFLDDEPGGFARAVFPPGTRPS